MKKRVLFFFSVFILSFNVKAQDGIENILLADISDATKLTEGYISPVMNGLIFGMNSGWYHTAKVHKSFGFDISIGANASKAPSKDEIFNLSSIQFSSKISKHPATTPTILGEDNAVTDAFEVTIPANSDSNINGGTHPAIQRTFTMPGGVKNDLPMNVVPTPAVQLNLGLPAKFEASLRLVPKIGDDVKGSLLGLGVKKEITNWFGPIKKTPLHISLMGTYTTMKVEYTIDDPSGNEINISNGLMDFKLNSYTIQALASLNFPIINFYGGIGYGGGNSTIKMTGTYNIDYDTTTPNTEKTLINPLNLKFNASGMKATIGTRLSLGFFKIFADYTLQEYNTVNAGIAFSFR